MLNATSSLNDWATGASQKPVGIAVVGLGYWERASPTSPSYP